MCISKLLTSLNDLNYLDWLADKIRAKFAFPGICWEKSFIPLSIWKVADSTTNIIESVHADVNREGVSCTLCGGVEKGRHFDTLKFKTLLVRSSRYQFTIYSDNGFDFKNWKETGIRPLYQESHISISTSRSLKRKGT